LTDVADEEHMARLSQGVDAWNTWRLAKSAPRPDLSGAKLVRADLRGANLVRADLIEAILNCAMLSGADLRGANLFRAKLIGADLTNSNMRGADLRDANLFRAELSGANLSDAKLSDATLNGANLICANLSGADLRNSNMRGADLRDANLYGANLSVDQRRAAVSGADLDQANLSGANLRDANLSQASLSDARLSGADLTNANLSLANLFCADLIEANLSHANLDSANLDGANLSRAELFFTNLIHTQLNRADLTQGKLGGTIFSLTDLTNVIGLETCQHHAPSALDHQTLERLRSLPKSFLQGVGLPDHLIENLPELLVREIKYYSCFISYSTKDQDFADRIYADLQNKGVRCWFALHDMPIGGEILKELYKGIENRQKLLLILSEHSIQSYWVQDEVTKAFEEERKRKQIVLFPIRLDNAVMDTNEAWAAKLRARNIGDFTHWKDDSTYQKSFERVLRDLAPRPNDKG
jgi:uncharacterized protein YjbI with pentapeptide repeats